MASKSQEIKLKIENQLIDMMEADNTLIWQCPWAFAARDRAYQGHNYNGVNCVVMALSRLHYGFNSHIWLTKTKIDNLNGRIWDEKTNKMKKVKWTDKFYKIRTGSKPTPVVFWSWKEVKENGEAVIDEDGNPKMYPLLRYFYAYNASQIEGLEEAIDKMEPCAKVLDESDIMSAEELEKDLLSHYESAPEVVHNADKACYAPSLDKVFIPAVSSFESKQKYISTLAHELAHSTGSESRLDRHSLKKSEVSVDIRAKEELVAEFTAAFISAHYGLEGKTAENSAAYLKSWFSVLRNNPGMLFDAIGLAEKAYERIIGEKEEDKEKIAI